MPYFLSTADLVTGNSYLDGEHQKLIALVDALIAACDSGASPGTVGLHMANLMAFAQGHFDLENTQMQRAGYDGRAAHAQDHDRLLHDVALLKAQLDAGNSLDCVETYHFMRRWLREHILGYDIPMLAAGGFPGATPAP